MIECEIVMRRKNRTAASFFVPRILLLYALDREPLSQLLHNFSSEAVVKVVKGGIQNRHHHHQQQLHRHQRRSRPSWSHLLPLLQLRQRRHRVRFSRRRQRRWHSWSLFVPPTSPVRGAVYCHTRGSVIVVVIVVVGWQCRLLSLLFILHR